MDHSSTIHRWPDAPRAGRAGKTGISHTFFQAVADKPRAGELVNVLREAKQDVPQELLRFGTHVKVTCWLGYQCPCRGATLSWCWAWLPGTASCTHGTRSICMGGITEVSLLLVGDCPHFEHVSLAQKSLSIDNLDACPHDKDAV